MLKLEICFGDIFLRLILVRLEVIQEQIIVSDHFTEKKLLFYDHHIGARYDLSSFLSHLLPSSSSGLSEILEHSRKLIAIILEIFRLFVFRTGEGGLECMQLLNGGLDSYCFCVIAEISQTV